jgi:hypothetical protein
LMSAATDLAACHSSADLFTYFCSDCHTCALLFWHVSLWMPC